MIILKCEPSQFQEVASGLDLSSYFDTPPDCVLVDKCDGYVTSSQGWFGPDDYVYFFTPPCPGQSGMWSLAELPHADIYTCEV